MSTMHRMRSFQPSWFDSSSFFTTATQMKKGSHLRVAAIFAVALKLQRHSLYEMKIAYTSVLTTFN